ncbi:transposase [Methylomonas koyamae]|uniref:transposase n=1 Tax=Methylomonas koyamae TaxID=702114 RepID=UPI00391C4816
MLPYRYWVFLCSFWITIFFGYFKNCVRFSVAPSGDAGYQGLDKRPEMPTENPPACVIAMRPGKLAKLTQDDSEEARQLHEAARDLASRRAKVEHVFRDIKVRFGYAKNRYRGLAKNAARLTFLTAIANVLRGDAYERRCHIASVI